MSCVCGMIFVAILFGEIPQGAHIGCIEVECDPATVVRDAYENARWLCDQYYLASPEIEVVEHNGNLINHSITWK